MGDAQLDQAPFSDRAARPGVQLCARCVMDSTIPKVVFDHRGVCNHCRVHDLLNRLFPVGEEGERFLQRIAEKIRRSGKGKSYDCVVGFSGGRDTSYCLYQTVRLGLRPLAVHFDNGWDSDIAKNNIRKVCGGLKVDLHSVIADWEESRELTNCSIRALVPYIDLTDDVGIISALYRSAAEEGVHWIIHSHSFRSEGINPSAWNYVDPRYVRDLVNRFCRIPLKHFHNPDLHELFYWMMIKRIRVFTITNYYQDAHQDIDELLKSKFGWEDTGGWHFDNEIFGLQSYYSRRKFGIDWRQVEFSALVREGAMTRDAALDELNTTPAVERKEIVDYALKKQGLTWEELDALIAAPNKTFADYKSYYPILRALRFPIKVFCRMNILPPHAYEKYFEL